MDDETSRTSLGSTNSRFTEDFQRNEKVRLETQLQDAQAELYNLRRMVPYLETSNPENPSETFRTLAMECASMREERDKLTKKVDDLQISKREELHRKDELIADLRNELQESREEVNRCRFRIQQLERDQSDEESRYYRQGLDEHLDNRQRIQPSQIRSEHSSTDAPLADGSSFDRGQPENRVNFRINEQATRDPQVRKLYNRMDEENSEVSSVHSQNPQELNFNYEANFTVTDSAHPLYRSAHQTGAPAANVNLYMNVLKNYRVNVRTLYEQMKSTAQFFVDILKRLGYENDPQIQLMMEKINQINLNMQDSKNLSKKVIVETKQIGNDLAELCRSFDRANRSLQGSHNSTIQGDKPTSANNQDLEPILQQKDDMIVQLRNHNTELDNKCQVLMADCNEFHMLTEQLEQRIQQSDAKNDELFREVQNREGIVNDLKLRLQAEIQERNDKISQLTARMTALLQSNRLSADTLAAKIQEGAIKYGFNLPDAFGFR